MLPVPEMQEATLFLGSMFAKKSGRSVTIISWYLLLS